jgi:hypothetical protein
MAFYNTNSHYKLQLMLHFSHSDELYLEVNTYSISQSFNLISALNININIPTHIGIDFSRVSSM